MNLRKFGALFLALVLTLSLCAVPAAGAGSDFEIEDGVLTQYTGAGGAVVIPDGVTAIGQYAFSDCTGLKSVTIPGSVTRIDLGAFHGCTGLTSVTIPDTVTKIGFGVFYDCTGLTSVTIPAGITEISDDVFYNTPWLKSLGEFAVVNHILVKYQGAGGVATIPAGITEIGVRAFYDCPGLTSVTIPGSVTEIGYMAFDSCTGLTSVTIPAGVTVIGSSAFSDCAGLTSVILPNSVTEIGDAAFEDTPWLKSLGEFAVANHILLAYQGAGGAVTIPGGVTKIGDRAFYDCNELTSVTIPAGVTEISEEAFSDCTGLTSVTIPGSVTEIGDAAFADTPWLESLGDLAIANNILLKYQGTGGAVTIPDGVTTINYSTFSGLLRPIGVAVPNSVTKIDDRAFDIYTDIIIYGGAGSYAQRYAKENGIPFEVGKVAMAPTAIAAPQTVLVDGKEVKFDAFALKDANGNMTNYFKARDVAMALNGTAAQFAVEWDGVVNLRINTAYTPNGSEMTTPFSGNQLYDVGDNFGVSVNGGIFPMDYIVLTDAKGNGYTYYKLRDLGEHLNFKVDWNGKNVTISTVP